MKLTYKEINKLFVSFLKENNALKAYRKNYINYCKSFFPNWKEINYLIPFTHKRLEGAIKKNRIGSLIDFSFCWAYTDEGFDFWAELDYQWRKKCKNDEITLKQETI